MSVHQQVPKASNDMNLKSSGSWGGFFVDPLDSHEAYNMYPLCDCQNCNSHNAGWISQSDDYPLRYFVARNLIDYLWVWATEISIMILAWTVWMWAFTSVYWCQVDRKCCSIWGRRTCCFTSWRKDLKNGSFNKIWLQMVEYRPWSPWRNSIAWSCRCCVVLVFPCPRVHGFTIISELSSSYTAFIFIK